MRFSSKTDPKPKSVNDVPLRRDLFVRAKLLILVVAQMAHKQIPDQKPACLINGLTLSSIQLLVRHSSVARMKCQSPEGVGENGQLPHELPLLSGKGQLPRASVAVGSGDSVGSPRLTTNTTETNSSVQLSHCNFPFPHPSPGSRTAALRNGIFTAA